MEQVKAKSRTKLLLLIPLFLGIVLLCYSLYCMTLPRVDGVVTKIEKVNVDVDSQLKYLLTIEYEGENGIVQVECRVSESNYEIGDPIKIMLGWSLFAYNNVSTTSGAIFLLIFGVVFTFGSALFLVVNSSPSNGRQIVINLLFVMLMATISVELFKYTLTNKGQVLTAIIGTIFMIVTLISLITMLFKFKITATLFKIEKVDNKFNLHFETKIFKKSSYYICSVDNADKYLHGESYHLKVAYLQLSKTRKIRESQILEVRH